MEKKRQVMFGSKILIGIPAYNFQVCSGLILSLVREVKKTRHEILVMSNHSCFIAHSRNEIVREGIKKGVDYIFFWDSDVEILTPGFLDTIVSLSRKERDAIVCVPYAMKTPEKKYNLIRRNEGTLAYISELPDTPFEVDAGGTGAMLIPTKIFKELEDPYFQMTAEKGTFIPEDWNFCDKAKEKGYRILVEPSVKTRHWGMYIWS